jgi:hypothetical protein
MDVLRKKYTGMAKGKRVNIVGAGPSAAGFVLPKGEHCILLNSSIKQYLDATPEQAKYLHALSSESTVWLFPWFWNNETFGGNLIGEKYAATRMPPEKIIQYPREFWARYVWFERVPTQWTSDKRNIGLQYDGNGEFDPLGTVAMQAIDLAARIMGASEVHSIGCELCFPQGKQHADGWTPYMPANSNVYEAETSEHQTQVCCTDGATITPDGKILTTPYFLKSAASIRAYMAATPHCKLIDHSGGLLSEAGGDALRDIAPAKPRARKAAQ